MASQLVESSPRIGDDRFFSRLGAAIKIECGRFAQAIDDLRGETGHNQLDRWRLALARAKDQRLRLYEIDGIAIVMGPGPRLIAYRTDGVHCECPRATSGDPICQHRALFRYVKGGLR